MTFSTFKQFIIYNGVSRSPTKIYKDLELVMTAVYKNV